MCCLAAYGAPAVAPEPWLQGWRLDLTDEGRQTLEADRRQRDGRLIRAISEGFSEQEQQAPADTVPLFTRVADA